MPNGRVLEDSVGSLLEPSFLLNPCSLCSPGTLPAQPARELRHPWEKRRKLAPGNPLPYPHPLTPPSPHSSIPLQGPVWCTTALPLAASCVCGFCVHLEGDPVSPTSGSGFQSLCGSSWQDLVMPRLGALIATGVGPAELGARPPGEAGESLGRRPQGYK